MFFIPETEAQLAELRFELSESRKLLQIEKDRRYDSEIQLKETENLIALIGADVSVARSPGVGMDLIHEVKFRKNLSVISEKVVLDDILDQLFQDDVMTTTYIEQLRNEESDHTRMSELLSQYTSGKLAYHNLRNALKVHYRFMLDDLDSTVVSRKDIIRLKSVLMDRKVEPPVVATTGKAAKGPFKVTEWLKLSEKFMPGIPGLDESSIVDSGQFSDQDSISATDVSEVSGLEVDGSLSIKVRSAPGILNGDLKCRAN